MVNQRVLLMDGRWSDSLLDGGDTWQKLNGRGLLLDPSSLQHAGAGVQNSRYLPTWQELTLGSSSSPIPRRPHYESFSHQGRRRTNL